MDVLEYFHKQKVEDIIGLLNISMFPITLLNRMFIPKLNARLIDGKKIKSAIINVTSLAGIT